MKRRSILRYALTASAAATLAGCGFRLRGSGTPTALAFSSIYLGFPEQSGLAAELKRQIEASGTSRVATSEKEADAILVVISELRDKSVQSLNTQGRVREYVLSYKLQFRVKDNQNKEMLGPTEVVAKRDISFNESQVLAKEAEEATLYRDMQTDVAQQVVRRLAAIKPAP